MSVEHDFHWAFGFPSEQDEYKLINIRIELAPKASSDKWSKNTCAAFNPNIFQEHIQTIFAAEGNIGDTTKDKVAVLVELSNASTRTHAGLMYPGSGEVILDHIRRFGSCFFYVTGFELPRQWEDVAATRSASRVNFMNERRIVFHRFYRIVYRR